MTLEETIGLDTPEDLQAVRSAVDAASSRPDTLRFLLRTRLRDALLDPDRVPPLGALAQAGFVTYRSRPGGAILEAPTLPTGARILVVSGPDVSVDGALTETFLRTLVAQGPHRVVAVEAGPKHPFVRSLRSSEFFRRKVSTVDDIETLEGRVAVVLAMEDLTRQLVGDYGTDASAQRLLPAAL